MAFDIHLPEQRIAASRRLWRDRLLRLGLGGWRPREQCLQHRDTSGPAFGERVARREKTAKGRNRERVNDERDPDRDP